MPLVASRFAIYFPQRVLIDISNMGACKFMDVFPATTE